jgi:hypothetical protein
MSAFFFSGNSVTNASDLRVVTIDVARQEV